VRRRRNFGCNLVSCPSLVSILAGHCLLSGNENRRILAVDIETDLSGLGTIGAGRNLAIALHEGGVGNVFEVGFGAVVDVFVRRERRFCYSLWSFGHDSADMQA
jgi:hypothetical protein